MSTAMSAHVRAIGSDPSSADGLDAAQAAGFDPVKILALIAKWGPVGAAMLQAALRLFQNYSWPAFWAFLQANGPNAFQFFLDFITLFGQPSPAHDHVGALPPAA